MNSIMNKIDSINNHLKEKKYIGRAYNYVRNTPWLFEGLK